MKKPAIAIIFLILMAGIASAEMINVTKDGWKPVSYNAWQTLISYCKQNNCRDMNLNTVINNALGETHDIFTTINDNFTRGGSRILVDKNRYNKMIEHMERTLRQVSVNRDLICRDTDEGLNPNIKGVVSGHPSNQYSDDYAKDYCVDDKTVREFALQSDCSIYYTDIHCEYKCSDGVCVNVTLNDCSEFGGDFWCGDEASFEGQCHGLGVIKEINGVCNQDGDAHCIQCRQESKYGEYCTDASSCAQGLVCTDDLFSLNIKYKTCCNDGECAADNTCYSSGEVIPSTSGSSHFCKDGAWEQKTCSDCGEGLFNLCDEKECTQMGCKFIDGLLWNSCLKDENVKVCKTGLLLSQSAPCSCGRERFIPGTVTGSMGTDKNKYCCNNQICSTECNTDGSCNENDIKFVREPYISQKELYVSIAWYVEGEPSLEFSYGKTQDYELGSFVTKSSAILGANYDYKVEPNTTYYFRISDASDATYSSSFTTLPRTDVCKDLGENYWCATDAEWQAECQGSGSTIDYSDCITENNEAGKCVTCQDNSAACTDTDGGIDYYKQGTMVWKVQNFTARDTCNGNTLTEYSCAEQQTNTEPYKTTTYECPNGCVDGACVSEDQVQTCRPCGPSEIPDPECNGNPLGLCLNALAKHGDRCLTGSDCESGLSCKPSGRYPENEKYCCNSDECASVMSTTRCVGFGGTDLALGFSSEYKVYCYNGKWFNYSCKDTDFGKNYYVKGHLSWPIQMYETDDSCNGDILTEYYCNGDQYGQESHECTNGCADGACISTDPNIQPYCYKPLQEKDWAYSTTYLGDFVDLPQGPYLSNKAAGIGLIYKSTADISAEELFGQTSQYGCAGKVDSVWHYDFTSGTWSMFSPDNPGFSDLATIKNGEVYAINLKESCTLRAPDGSSFWKSEECPYGCQGGICAQQKSCTDSGGNACNSGEVCTGTKIDSADTSLCCNGTCEQNPAVLTINALYTEGNIIAKRARIYVDGVLKSENGSWQGYVSAGSHTVHFDDINDGEWYTLIKSQDTNKLFNEISYCDDEDRIIYNNAPNCSNWKQLTQDDFVSKVGESGTSWLARQFIYPDANAPDDVSFSVSSQETKSIIGRYDESDSYYYSDKYGNEHLGFIPMTDGSFGSGTQGYSGKNYTNRYEPDYYNYYFVRVKTVQTPILVKQVSPSGIWVYEKYEITNSYLKEPHQGETGFLTDKDHSAIFWSAVPNVEFSTPVREEVKEDCAAPVYGSWYDACSPNGYYLGRERVITKEIVQPQTIICHYLTDPNDGHCLGPEVRSNYACVESTSTDFTGTTLCGYTADDMCSESGGAHCIDNSPTYLNIGSTTSSGHNNIVEFCGKSGGVTKHAKATCTGDWSVNPCSYTSSCSTGWSYNPADYYDGGCTDHC